MGERELLMSKRIKTMNELKDCFFEMLTVFDEYCSTNGIEYWLWGGTLIGAVRDKDFIAWDDDVDIIMKRDSYEKLKKCSKESLPEGFSFITPNKGHFYDFISEFASNNYTVERIGGSKKRTYGNSVVSPMMDVFVLDECNTGLHHRIKMARLFILYGLSRGHRKFNKPLDMGHRTGHKFPDSLIKHGARLLERIGRNMDMDRIIERYNKVSSSRERGADHLFISNDQIWCLSKVYPKAFFDGEKCSGSIRGRPFPIPARYDECLRDIYGDYEQYPPEDKRRPYHYKVKCNFSKK